MARRRSSRYCFIGPLGSNGNRVKLHPSTPLGTGSTAHCAASAAVTHRAYQAHGTGNRLLGVLLLIGGGTLGGVNDRGAADYGQLHAWVYDRIYGARFTSAAAVEALAAAAGSGAVLELGVGTGRLAIPLTRRGIVVDGIDASPAMLARLRAQPGGDAVGALEADLADFTLARRDYTVAVCAVSTLFMLTHDEQRRCVRAAAAHLRPGGRLFVETFRPDPSRFDADGDREEHRPAQPGQTHVVRSHHDHAARSIHITHELGGGPEAGTYDVTLYYATFGELDDLAAGAGLRLAQRWHDWTRTPARADSSDPISVYLR